MNLLIKICINCFATVFLALLFQTGVLADEILWESGLNLYIKITDQDEYSDGKKIPNQHPVTLEAKEITNALTAMKIWEKGSDKASELQSVFTVQQSTLLGQYLSTGLQKAGPDEDIIFALVSNKKSYVVMKDTYYLAGRAFYANDQLHIIIGDYDRLPDKFRERAVASHGDTSGIQYFFDNGSRSDPSKFKKAVITKDGIDNYKDGSKLRRDWFVINVKQASDAYIAELEANKKRDPAEVNAEAIRVEAAKIAKERREMRMEMARLRKEMSEAQGGDGGALTVEERLKKLDELKEKGLVTGDEYEAKRKEILGDI